MALSTVGDYVSSARFLLQDTVPTYRYSDADVVNGLNMAVAELVRLRPDLYFIAMRTGAVPSYVPAAPTDVVDVDNRYSMPILYFIVGYVQLSDEEDVQDQRAVALLGKFTAQVTGTG
jgi:hypothetical protein